MRRKGALGKLSKGKGAAGAYQKKSEEVKVTIRWGGEGKYPMKKGRLLRGMIFCDWGEDLD